MRDTAGAENAFRAAIRVQPDFAPAHANLGGLLAGRNDLPQARRHFEAAVAAGAAQFYRLALQLKPDMEEAKISLAMAERARR